MHGNRHFLALPSGSAYSYFEKVRRMEAIDPAILADGAMPECNAKAEVSVAASTDDAGAPAAVAIIPVRGQIVPTAPRMAEFFGVTGVNLLKARLDFAKNDAGVKGVLLDIDSPGGSVLGLTEAAALIRDFPKPVTALANHIAASGAYWLGSQAKSFYATPSGVVGSVGVISAHENIKGMLDNMGIEVTLITAGARKAEGSEFAPLDEEAKANIQARVDEWYRIFVGDVAAGRGVSQATVREKFGEGAVMLAKEALDVGAIDGIATPDEVLATVMRKGKARAVTTVAETPAPAPKAEEKKGVHPSVALRRLAAHG